MYFIYKLIGRLLYGSNFENTKTNHLRVGAESNLTFFYKIAY